jgi:hypothetical protein
MDELYCQADIIKSAKNEILDKNEVAKASFADVLMNNIDKSCDKKEAVVIIKPKNKKQGNDKTKNDLKNLIDPNVTPINGLINTKDSAIILKCKKKEDVNKIKNTVEFNSEIYDAEIPVSKSPRIKIVGLSEKPLNNEEIIKTLKKQNYEFFDDSCVIKVVTVLQMKNKKGGEYFNLIIEVNPKTYRKIMAIEDAKINFDFYRCKVFDALHVRRCLKCCSLDGHTAKDCDKEIVCFKCSGNHKSNACTKGVLKCINCDAANRKFNLKLDTAHNALERECPAYQRELKRKAKSIDYFE